MMNRALPFEFTGVRSSSHGPVEWGGVRPAYAAPGRPGLAARNSTQNVELTWAARLARDNRGEDFPRVVRRRKLLRGEAHDLPLREFGAQGFVSEKAISFGGKHVHIRRPFSQDVDHNDAARANPGLKLCQLLIGRSTVEEHEQSNAHDGIEVFGEFVRPEIRLFNP